MVILPILIKGDPAICNNVEEFGGRYTKWNMPDTGRKPAPSHSHVEPKKVEYAESES